MVVELRQRGLEKAAVAVDVALGGSTSGEILEQLWFAFLDVERLIGKTPGLEEALGYINRVLGPPK